MPRPRAIDPAVPIRIQVRPDLAAKLELLAFSPLAGKRKFGAISAIVNDALEQYFAKEQTNAEPGINQSSGPAASEGAAGGLDLGGTT